jgi:sarcosine oxidase subunit gamma
MSALEFTTRGSLDRFGLKGPAAADWLAAHGIVVPPAPNTWAGAAHTGDETILVARLGAGEFFVEDCVGGTALRGLLPPPEAHPPGVYPVVREDAAFLLCGEDSLDVLAQVCNVNFGDLSLDAHPVIMTSMIGVSVLVIPQDSGAERQYRIWCDPTFGSYLQESVSLVVSECGSNNRGGSA